MTTTIITLFLLIAFAILFINFAVNWEHKEHKDSKKARARARARARTRTNYRYY